MKGIQAREGQERVQERPVHGDCTFVVFGGTGDLARRKILPALSRLRHDGLIDDNLTIPLFVGFATWIVCGLYGVPLAPV